MSGRSSDVSRVRRNSKACKGGRALEEVRTRGCEGVRAVRQGQQQWRASPTLALAGLDDALASRGEGHDALAREA